MNKMRRRVIAARRVAFLDIDGSSYNIANVQRAAIDSYFVNDQPASGEYVSATVRVTPLGVSVVELFTYAISASV